MKTNNEHSVLPDNVLTTIFQFAPRFLEIAKKNRTYRDEFSVLIGITLNLLTCSLYFLNKAASNSNDIAHKRLLDDVVAGIHGGLSASLVYLPDAVNSGALLGEVRQYLFSKEGSADQNNACTEKAVNAIYYVRTKRDIENLTVWSKGPMADIGAFNMLMGISVVNEGETPLGFVVSELVLAFLKQIATENVKQSSVQSTSKLCDNKTMSKPRVKQEPDTVNTENKVMDAVDYEYAPYEQALDELKNKTYIRGIWARAYSETETVEQAMKQYIKYRAQDLLQKNKKYSEPTRSKFPSESAESNEDSESDTSDHKDSQPPSKSLSPSLKTSLPSSIKSAIGGQYIPVPQYAKLQSISEDKVIDMVNSGSVGSMKKDGAIFIHVRNKAENNSSNRLSKTVDAGKTNNRQVEHSIGDGRRATPANSSGSDTGSSPKGINSKLSTLSWFYIVFPSLVIGTISAYNTSLRSPNEPFEFHVGAWIGAVIVMLFPSFVISALFSYVQGKKFSLIGKVYIFWISIVIGFFVVKGLSM